MSLPGVRSSNSHAHDKLGNKDKGILQDHYLGDRARWTISPWEPQEEFHSWTPSSHLNLWSLSMGLLQLLHPALQHFHLPLQPQDLIPQLLVFLVQSLNLIPQSLVLLVQLYQSFTPSLCPALKTPNLYPRMLAIF